eukprot:scaffold119892_cov30-Tisochrysis_lutea.AAC.3
MSTLASLSVTATSCAPPVCNRLRTTCGNSMITSSDTSVPPSGTYLHRTATRAVGWAATPFHMTKRPRECTKGRTHSRDAAMMPAATALSPPAGMAVARVASMRPSRLRFVGRNGDASLVRSPMEDREPVLPAGSLLKLHCSLSAPEALSTRS